MDSIYTQTKIGTVSGECGRWKTTANCKYIEENQDHQNHMYTAPTVKLLEQTEEKLTEIGVKCTMIHSGNTKKVSSAIVEYLKGAWDHGHVLLITWKAYSEIPYFAKRDNWKIFIDEVPQLDTQHFLRIPYTHGIITEYLDIDDQYIIQESVAKVIPKDSGKLKRFIDDQVWKDDGYMIYHDLFKNVLSQNKDVFVDLDSWNKICENHDVSKQDEKNFVYFISLMNPKLFMGATLLGANIEYSMLHLWFTQYHDAGFIEHDAITSGLRDRIDYSNRLRISYFIDGKANSKHLKNRTVGKSGKTVSELVDKEIIKQLGDKDFLFTENNDYIGNVPDLPNCKRIPVDSKGMNQYAEYTRIVHLPSLNRHPKQLKMLNLLGIDNETIRVSTGFESLYQNVMRTALRNPESKDIIDVFVLSKFEADYLISVFGENEMKQTLDVGFKNYAPLTKTQRNNRSKYKKVKSLLLSVEEDSSINETSQNRDNILISKGNSPENGRLLNDMDTENNTLKIITPPTEQSYDLTFHKSKNDDQPDQFNKHEFSYQKFKRIMKQSSKTVIDNKDEMFMINSGIYNTPANPDNGFRTYDNLIQNSMLILDYDDGDISINNFENIFWNNAGKGLKRSFIICNSYSRSKDKPNKFRVFMPFDQPTTTIEQYQAIFDAILKRLESKGYTRKSMALDNASRNANQSYYMPCTNRGHIESHYFKAYGWRERELKICSIKTLQYVKTAMNPLEKAKIIQLDDYRNRKPQRMSDEQRNQKIEQIKQEYSSIPVGLGQRNNGIFNAALKLLNLMDEFDVRSTLHELANHDQKMINRIDGLMKNAIKLQVA